MIHIAWPWMALLLPLPWIIRRIFPPHTQKGIPIFLPFATPLLSTFTLPITTRSTWQRFSMLCIWLLLILAAMRPQWQETAQPLPSEGRRLLLAVDVSGSMATQDMEGQLTRLQVVQKVAGEFIKHRQGDRIGLILFGTQPYLQTPLTADLQTVEQFLYESMIGIAGQETAIGDAIGLALKRLREDAKRSSGQKETVLVLLTDGVSNAGNMPPLEASKLAAQDHLRIYTIGVGAAVQEGFLGLMMQGNADLDEKTLQQIAQTTGGRYFRATDATALKQVYEQINTMEPSAGEQQWYRPSKEWFPWPLGIAFLLSCWLGFFVKI